MLQLDNYECFGTSGSGNQKKFWINNKLIKLDSKRHESLKEKDAYIVGKAFGLNMVKYDVISCEYEGRIHKACICESFMKLGEEAVALFTILNYKIINIDRNMSAKEYFNITCNTIMEFTGLDARQYLMNMLVFDFLVANRDRHLSNIEFIHGQNGYRFTPLFDNGQSFFDSNASMTDAQLEQAYKKFKTMPFSRNPKSNLIDIGAAKRIANQFRVNSGDFKNIQVSDLRKHILIFMYKKLMQMT